jgi:acetylornithine deacetylase/succinyl-diaminopimelate desuccinylase-like protein
MDENIIDRILDLAVQIQQIPAPTFSEEKRAAFILACFEEEDRVEVQKDEMGNVFARLPGRAAGPPIVVSAHSDTVFPAATGLPVERRSGRITGPGIGDNALGLAGLFGIIWSLNGRERLLRSDLWLVANVGEEGLGDLCGMRAVVDRFKMSSPTFLVLEGMALGQVYHRGLGVRRYRITARTSGGHSWVDHGEPSAVHELVSLASRLVELPLPAQPRTTLNIGVISGGYSVNTIAAEACLELDLRSEGVHSLAELTARVKALIRRANRPGVQMVAELIGQRPVGEISVHHPLVSLAVQSLIDLGLQPCLNIGSTDANLPLSEGYPAICIGLTTGRGAHTMNEYILTRPLRQGLEHVLAVIEGIDRNPRPN